MQDFVHQPYEDHAESQDVEEVPADDGSHGDEGHGAATADDQTRMVPYDML